MSELQKMAQQALAVETDHPSVEFEGRWYGWAEMRRVAQDIARLVQASGAHPRAPFVFIGRSQPAALAALAALIASGRNIRMVYPFQSPEGVARDIVRLRPGVVVAAERDYTEAVQAAIREQGASAIVIREMEAAALPGFERSTAELDPSITSEQMVEILTSGTTGPPKQFQASCDMFARAFVKSGWAPGGVSDFGDVPVLLYFPLGNISGLYTILPPLLTGRRMILLERFNLDAWRDYIRRFKPVRSGLPASAIQMVLDADIPREELAGLRSMGAGAAPVDPTVQREFEAKYGIPILLSYGATEFGGPVTAMTEELYAEWGQKKFGTVGRPIGDAKLRAVDPETGEPVAPGEEGLLEVISPRIGPHWIRTSDIGVVDEDGFVFHRGRADGAIMRGGFKVLPETIERALMRHDAISEAGVVGIPDRRLGQVPAAALVLKPDTERPTLEALEEHLRREVIKTHIPVRWMFVERLPRNNSFKIDRPGVARLFQEEGQSA